MDNREPCRISGTFAFHLQIGEHAAHGELCIVIRAEVPRVTRLPTDALGVQQRHDSSPGENTEPHL